MLGAAITFALCLVIAAGTTVLARPLLRALDPAARFGITGLLGLGFLGTLFLGIGLAPGGVRLLLPITVGLAIIAALAAARDLSSIRFSMPATWKSWAFFIASAALVLLPLITACTPSTTLEWDAIAYHLAVPKLWLEAGQIESVPFIHHSNFPFAIDNLFLVGLQWGESGAKTFVLGESVLGCLAIFGLARQHYGVTAARWALLAFASVPAVIWLSGTAYIDVPNGLYAGLGFVLLAFALRTEGESRLFWLGGLMLGLAAGSKYTGLQAIFAAGVSILIVGSIRRSLRTAFTNSLLVAGIALLVASPWYVRNYIWTGNPVYPFFYERLGGRNWGPDHARIYKAEQQTFGVGASTTRLGHAVLGTVYQPGRYTNPGQTRGEGNPLAATGCVVLGGLLIWMFSGRMRRFEWSLALPVLISFGLWSLLSQQSRYLLPLVPPLALLVGGAVVALRAGPVLKWITASQVLYSAWLAFTLMAAARLPVLLGSESPQDFRSKHIGFFQASQAINQVVPEGGKVALYDEVFGYLLDVPYFWANPGHSALISYARLPDGPDLARELRAMGFTHVYVSLLPLVRPPDQAQRWVAAMGLQGEPVPYTPSERQSLMSNFEQRFVPLIAEAAANGDLRLLEAYPSGLLFEIRN